MPLERRPWPMKWIIVAIVAVIVPYTYLTLHYRKSGPAFQPYADMKNRANVTRLLAAGYQRIPLPAQSAAPTPVLGGAAVTPAPGGLPADLRSTLVETPLLSPEITNVTAAAVAQAAEPYVVQFTCALPGERQRLVGAELYVRGDRMLFLPFFEAAPPAAARNVTATLNVPANILKPGRHDSLLVGERASLAWALDVK